MQQVITTPNQIAEILRGRRKSRGVSQRELAAKLGVSQGRLSTLEGNPDKLTLDRLLALANMLGLELIVQTKRDAPPTADEW